MTSTYEDRTLLATDVAIKAPCRAATTANITLNGLQTVDGIVLATNDRVLVKNQTSGVDNGIYLASTGSWVRTSDADGNRDIVDGTLVLVRLGTVSALALYECSCATSPANIGTTTLTFNLVSVVVGNAGNFTTLTASGLITANGGQIQFPALQIPSAGVNVLDDYEEGLWTPTLGGSATYSINRGTYTKAGRLVFVQMRINVTAIGTGSTTVVGGLPFQNASSDTIPVSVTLTNSLATPVVSVSAGIDGGGLVITFYSRTAAAASDSLNPIFGNGAVVFAAGCYYTT